MTVPRVAIVDYQAGNVRSVQKALERCGAHAEVTADPAVFQTSDAMVFPGQGACDSSMRALRQRGLVDPIKAFVGEGKPFLGVCLGLQLLLDGSDEGDEPGLGLVKGWARRLPEGDGRKIPHMGWNSVDLQFDSPLFGRVPNGSYFYFVHSYYADPVEQEVVLGETSYGIDFCSALERDNVAAVQFHPEKSGEIGLTVYENFVRAAARARRRAA